MNRKLLAGLAATGILVGGGGAAAVTTAGVPSATASTVVVASSTFHKPWAWHGPLASLVAKGTITRSQAMAIHEGLVAYMVSHRQAMHGFCHGGMSAIMGHGGALDTVLGQLVGKGTITNAQASAVTSAVTQWVQAHRGLRTGYHGCGWGMMRGSGKGTMQHNPAP
jgi:hypothetical protein